MDQRGAVAEGWKGLPHPDRPSSATAPQASAIARAEQSFTAMTIDGVTVYDLTGQAAP